MTLIKDVKKSWRRIQNQEIFLTLLGITGNADEFICALAFLTNLIEKVHVLHMFSFSLEFIKLALVDNIIVGMS